MEQTMIRGFPRPSDNVRFVENMLGGSLVSDNEPGLMLKLDNALRRARAETGEFPEYIALPSEPMSLFVPMPYELHYGGLTLMVYNKPAWFRVKRSMAVSWRKDVKPSTGAGLQ